MEYFTILESSDGFHLALIDKFSRCFAYITFDTIDDAMWASNVFSRFINEPTR